MGTLREWIGRLRETFRGRSTNDRDDWDDWNEELRLHLDLAAEAARRRGEPAAAAARSARIRAGHITQTIEAMNDQRHFRWLDDFARDLRHGFIGLKRHPGFAMTAVLTLALGIGINSAIFSVVYAVVLRPLPYREAERLVAPGGMLAGEYLYLRNQTGALSDLALYQENVGFNLSHAGGAERSVGAHVSTNFFATLGATAVEGRTFHADEELPGKSGVVVLSHAMWRQRFGSDRAIVGRDVLIDNEPRRVIGVMPQGFSFPSPRTEFWVPYTFDPANTPGLWGGGQRGEALARLSPAMTAAQAQAELRAREPALRKANTLWVLPAGWGADRVVVELHERLVGEVRPRLLLVLGAVGVVLLIACLNVANLLLARASARQREVAIRRALGAGRGRIVRQFLTESMVLALIGSAVGLLLAFVSVPMLVRGLPADLPRADEIGVDQAVLAFTLGFGLLTGLIFGALPAFRGAGVSGAGTPGLNSRGAATSLGRTANLIVVTEVAVAVLLVVGASLLIRSFAELLRVEPGFSSERILTARATPPAGRYGDDERTRQFYGSLLERVSAIRGVERAEASSHLPLVGGPGGFAFEVEGRPYARGTAAPTTALRSVTPGYLQAMGIPVRQGRGLVSSDRHNSPRVAVINDTMARTFWPGQDPVGKRFKAVWNNDWITVVGVAGDVRYDGLASQIEPEVYRPFSQAPARDMSLVVRASSDPAGLAMPLREALAAVDRTVPLSEIRTIDQLLARSVATPRFTMLLLAGFAMVALALAAIGIYGVLSYTVSRRAREICVRVALGARRVDVLRTVLGHAAALAGAGIALGMAAALATTHVMQGLLFGVSQRDALTFAAAPLVLAAVAFIAA